MTRYVLVTGAYGGMGSAAVKALTERGFIVFALDRKVGGAAENVVPIEADVTDPESLQRAFDSVRGVTDRLFAIIHYAGIYTLDSLIEIPDAGFERMLRVNVFGAFHVNKIFLPLLADGSRIIMTTSELAPLDSLPFTGLYAVTKSALFAPDGIAASWHKGLGHPRRGGQDKHARRLDRLARHLLRENKALQMQRRALQKNSRQRRA